VDLTPDSVLKFGEPSFDLMLEIRKNSENEKLETVRQSIEAAPSPEELQRIWAG